jgi:hypothetical protein
MGQVHSLEALRLLAAAMQMHAGAEAAPSASMFDSNVLPGLAWDQTPPPTVANDTSPIESPVFVVQSELDDTPNTPQAGLAKDAGQFTLASAMSRMLGNEPVQIRTDSLRSMSSNSLCRMAMQEEGGEDHQEMLDFPSTCAARDAKSELLLGKHLPALGPSEAFDTGELTIKNTFLDFAPPTSALRSVRTAGGRLDLLGGLTPSSASFDVSEK